MKTFKSMKTITGILGIVAALLVMSVFAFGAEFPEKALGHANPRVKEVMAVQEELTSELMSMEDVIGTAVGQVLATMILKPEVPVSA